MSDQIQSILEKQKSPPSKEVGISFFDTIKENRRYMTEQYEKGFVNRDQFERFEKFTQESLEKYGTSVEEATKHFNEGREKVLRDTGIELSKEKAVSDMQLRLYEKHSIDRYTYKNGPFRQFNKGLIDGLIVGNYELVVMIQQQGMKVFENLLSMDTLRHILSSLGESFMDVFTGDAYMKGKSIVTVILSTMGAAAFLNIITRGALKAGISKAVSGVNRRVADAYMVHTPKIDALDLTSGRNFPKPQGKIFSHEISPVVKSTSVVASVWVASQTVAAPETIVSRPIIPEKISHSVHLPKNSYEIQGNTLLIRTFDNISEAELETSINILIRDNKIKTLRLDSSISHDAQRQVANIVMRNHPLFEMMRLVHGNDVVNVTFGGIKDLNDMLGQKFVDDFVGWIVRREIISRFDQYSEAMVTAGQKSHNRLVRNDYKNITPSFGNGTFSNWALFGPESDKKSFIDSLIRANDTMIQEVAKEKGFTPDFVRQTLRERFDFWVGMAKVVDETPVWKMQAFYEAEIISREGLKLPGIEVVMYDIKKIEECAQKAVQIEHEILRDSFGRYFTFRWVEYPVTLSIRWKRIINPHLLGYVRKHSGEFEMDSHLLVSQIQELISNANRGFDFIAPVRNWSDDIARAEMMEHNFQQGVINTEYIQKTFKGVWTKEALITNVQGKKGMLVFLDVRDMGIDNIQSFLRLARKVASGKYDKADLMTGWDSVTNKFIALTNHLKTKNISLGGDEWYLFFEWIGPEGAEAVIADIHKALAESGLRGRLAHGFDTTDVAKTFKTLDSSTKVHKMFEETLDSFAVQKNIDSHSLQRTVHVEIPYDIQTNDFVAWLKSSSLIQSQVTSLLDDIKRWVDPIQKQFLYQWEGRNFMTEMKYQWDFLNIHFISQ